MMCVDLINYERKMSNIYISHSFQSVHIEQSQPGSSSSSPVVSEDERRLPSPMIIQEDIGEVKQITPERFTVLKERISEKAAMIDELGIGILGMHLKDSALARTVVDTLRGINTLATGKVAVFNEDFLKVSIGDDKHVYVKYDSSTDSLQILFDNNHPMAKTSGANKGLFQGYIIKNQSEITRLILTKESEKLGRSFLDPRNSPFYREQEGLLLCHGCNIPNTPQVYFISAYKSKAGLGKQAILQKFQSGGDLYNIKVNLSEKETLNIVAKMAKTIALFHENGLNYNDLKLENIVLDESNNPTLIDYGSAILDKDLKEMGRENLKITTTWNLYSPEMFIGGDQESLIKHFQRVNEVRGEIQRAENNYNFFKEKCDELYEQIDSGKKNDQVLTTDELDGLKAQQQEAQSSLWSWADKYEEFTETLESLTENIGKLIEDNVDVNGGYIPKCADNYALGLLLLSLYGSEPVNPEIKAIMNGLLAIDPQARMTAHEASDRLNRL